MQSSKRTLIGSLALCTKSMSSMPTLRLRTDSSLLQRSTWTCSPRSILPPRLQRTELSGQQERLHHKHSPLQLAHALRVVPLPTRLSSRSSQHQSNRMLRHMLLPTLSQQLHLWLLHLTHPLTHLDRRLRHRHSPRHRFATHTFLKLILLDNNSHPFLHLELDMVPTACL
jgi:hypothetical protein